MKFSLKILLLALLVILCAAFIFSNSFKDSAASHADSDGIVKFVKQIAEKILPNNEIDWNYTVRKGAHLFEFFLLGIGAAFFAFCVGKHRYKILTGWFLFVLLVASCDEFIQRFTGRSSRISDVLIDLSGACIGFVTVMVIRFLVRRKRS